MDDIAAPNNDGEWAKAVSRNDNLAGASNQMIARKRQLILKAPFPIRLHHCICLESGLYL